MKRIILIVLAVSLQACGMDAPAKASAQEIPAELQLKYGQERDRFRSYKLDHPEDKFLSKLRRDLKKDEEITDYLKNLHIFANLLLAQHLILNQAIQATYINNYQTNLINNEQNIVKKLGAKEKENSQFSIFPPNVDALNEIVAHQSILSAESLTPEQLKIVFSWSLKDDVWFQALAEYLLNRHILKLIVEERRKAVFKTSEIIIIVNDVSEDNNIEYDDLLRIIKINTQLMYELNQEREKAEKRLNIAESRKTQYAKSYSSLTEDFSNAVIRQGLLYTYTHNWYKQLYKIVRNEISTTIKDIISQKTTITGIGKYAANLFLELLPEKILPLELPLISNPVHLLSPTDFEQEKIKIKLELDQEQKRKDEERKRKNKIKQTPDESSYILEYQDTPAFILIHNDKNNTQEVIFKHESLFEIDKSDKKIFPIKYTDWVKQWFTNAETAREEQGYTNPKSTKYRAGEPAWKPKVLHAFSPLVDDYIRQWGRITTTKNRRNPAQEDILITIPGKIIYPEGSKPQEEAGVFAYIIDSANGQWYHRMFTTGSLSELSKNLFEKGYFAPEMTGYYDVFFPPLAPRKK